MKSGRNDKGEPIRTELRGISKHWNFALIGTDANRDLLTGEPMVCIPLALLASPSEYRTQESHTTVQLSSARSHHTLSE